MASTKPVESIEKYVSENDTRLTFEEKAARSALHMWMRL